MDEFIKSYSENRNIKPDLSEKEIINNLMVKNAKLGEKTLSDVEAYDSETLFDGKLYRGNIYIFKYDAKNPTKYSYKGEDVYFSDDLPVVFMLREAGQNCIRGINLNFCNKDLKLIILNTIQNLDPNFYHKGGIQKLITNKNLPISEKVYTFLCSNNCEQLLMTEIIKLFKKPFDYNAIIRTYNVNNIKDIRLIEPWQWKYIVNLNYQGSLKKETLEAILKISGIE